MNTTDVITQSELQLLHNEQERASRYSRHRNDVKSRVLDGAAVEPGPFQVRITKRRERRVNTGSLQRLFGAAIASIILKWLPRTTSYVMTLSDDGEAEFEDELPAPVFHLKVRREPEGIEMPKVSINRFIQLLRSIQ